jgi:tetratricopeptide (TPR) repeat protein
MKKFSIKIKALLIAGLFILVGCDFTSGLNRNILVAQHYVDNQEYDRAAKAYELILKQNPQKSVKTKLHYQLAEIYYLYLNEKTKALEHYQFIIDHDDDPRNQVKALEKIADINFDFKKDYKQAIRAYTLLLRFQPRLQNADEYEYKLAESYFESGQLSDAEIKFSQINMNTFHTYHIDSFFHQGLLKFYQKNWEGAVEMWLQYIKREKRKEHIVKAKFLIANAYESGEKLKEAYNIYYSLLDDHPNPQMIKDRLKALYARRVARKR